jgi:hypothetical protein
MIVRQLYTLFRINKSFVNHLEHSLQMRASAFVAAGARAWAPRLSAVASPPPQWTIERMYVRRRPVLKIERYCARLQMILQQFARNSRFCYWRRPIACDG